MRWSKYRIFFSLTLIFVVIGAALLIHGSLIYHRNTLEKNSHEENACEVLTSSYYESTCTSGGRVTVTSRCFIPVWVVAYISIVEGIHINATIEHSGLKTAEAAQNMLDQYQIGMTYACWCNIKDPSMARWNRPSNFVGMMLLIFGGIASALGLTGVFLTYRAHIRR